MTWEYIMKTHDLQFAAYLKAKHQLRLVNIHKDRRGRVTWEFDSKIHNVSWLVNDFYVGGTVSAIDYAQELRKLKSAIYNAVSNDNEDEYEKHDWWEASTVRW